MIAPYIARKSLRIHEAAESSYRLWSILPRQFLPGSLTTIASLADFSIDPFHAVQNRHGDFQIFAGFSAYQRFLSSTSGNKKRQIPILCYSELSDPQVEVLSLTWLLRLIEDNCLDRTCGLEQLRASLNSLIDKRVLESVCNTNKMSRSEFAPRAKVLASTLKAQARNHTSTPIKKRGGKHHVLRKLSR